jgi:hypothetical protein
MLAKLIIGVVVRAVTLPFASVEITGMFVPSPTAVCAVVMVAKLGAGYVPVKSPPATPLGGNANPVTSPSILPLIKHNVKKKIWQLRGAEKWLPASFGAIVSTPRKDIMIVPGAIAR